MKLSLAYHKIHLKSILKDYVYRMRGLDCGRGLAVYMFSWVNELERKMDYHILAINKLEGKSFPLFCEGYLPSMVLN